jgi:hypothetical protein
VQFVLVRFTQSGNIRHFIFEGVTAERARIAYTVDADLLRLREYKISVQELPLMCRRLLEAAPEADPARAFSLTDQHMRQHAAAATAALEQAASKRRAQFNGRKPGQPSNFGQMRTVATAASAAPPVRTFPTNTRT